MWRFLRSRDGLCFWLRKYERNRQTVDRKVQRLIGIRKQTDYWLTVSGNIERVAVSCNIERVAVSRNIQGVAVSRNIQRVAVNRNIQRVAVSCNIQRVAVSCNILGVAVSCNIYIFRDVKEKVLSS